MKRIKERDAIRWVIGRDGQLAYQDNGRVIVDLKGTTGSGISPDRALKDWKRRRRKKR